MTQVYQLEKKGKRLYRLGLVHVIEIIIAYRKVKNNKIEFLMNEIPFLFIV